MRGRREGDVRLPRARRGRRHASEDDLRVSWALADRSRTICVLMAMILKMLLSVVWRSILTTITRVICGAH